MATKWRADMRQFCNACHRKIIDGFCPDPCKGDGRALFRVMDAAGGEIVCDTVMARNSTEARAMVRKDHMGEPNLRRLVVDRVQA
jgi:hypothetical protein